MAIRTVTRAGVGLVVGIIILGLLVLGGLWLVRERGEQARREEAISIAEQQLQDESSDGVALNSDDNEEGSTAKPGDAASEPEGATTIPEGGTSATNPEAANELPQTGPADQLGIVAVLTLVTFSIATYAGSRKQVKQN